MNHHRIPRIATALLAAASVTLSAGAAFGQDVSSQPPRSDAATDADRLRLLEAKVHQLDSALAARPVPKEQTGIEVRAGAQGFQLASSDGRFSLRLRGYFQSDTRVGFGDGASQLQRGLLLRRVRPVWEVTMGKVADVRFMPDFGEGRPTIYDAHLDLHFTPLLNIRSGKFKPPVGLERLQSATDIAFIERSHANSLVPNRDIGSQLYGSVGRAWSYTLGLFNGVPDIGFGDVETDRFKDLVARLTFEPLKLNHAAGADEMQLAVSMSNGEHRGTIAAAQTPTYRSPLQESIFRFRGDGTAAGTVVADGKQSRLSPSAYGAFGPVGLMGEYVVSTQHVRRDATYGAVRNTAWQGTVTWALTGEHASYRGLTPLKPADPAHGRWGAVELVGRISALDIDRAAFPVFADTASQIRGAFTVGGGVNWHLLKGIKVMADYTWTRFDGGAPIGDRFAEHNFSTRFQHAF
jgi:phosphate-selective porin OprO and OprP